jgi:PAS domain S-box-containing protein
MSATKDGSSAVGADVGLANESEQHLAAIVDSSDDAIVSMNLEGTILSWNDAATRVYGYTTDEAVDQKIGIVIPDDRLNEERNIRASIARGEPIQHYETVRQHKDGTLIEVSLSMSPVRDAAGRIVAAAGFARDISERKLFQASQHLAAIVDNSDDAIVSKDLEAGTIQTWNEAATRMYGYTADEAIGQRIDIVIPDDGLDEERNIRASIARGEQIEHYETVRQHKDGSLIEVSLSLSPVRDASGRIVAAAGFARDISETKRAFETKQRLAAIVDNSDDAIVSKDLETGTIQTWNEAATRMYGYTADEAIGQRIDIVIPDDGLDEERNIRASIALGEQIQHYETIRQNKDGGLIEVSLSLSPVRDASGRIVAAAGFARDISERKLFLVSQGLAAIVDNSDDAIVSKDLETGTIQTWNEAATRMYGYTADEAIGRKIDMVIPNDRLDEERDLRGAIARGEQIQHYETVRQNKDGNLIEVSLSISPVRDASGRIVAAARIARDISQRKKLEQERERATDLLERFVDFTSHDFKAPMRNVLMDAQEISRLLAGSEDPHVQHLLGQIVANSRWMHHQTEGLLRASTLQGRRQVRTTVPTEEVFDKTLDILRSVDQFVAGAAVDRDDLPAVVSDDKLLGFLFSNLLQNACKYGRDSTLVSVRVSASREPNGWTFLVADNGLGIEPALVEEIFEPYVRGQETGVPGTGIGLSLCRRIVEWHGGRIWVESELGRGSTFKFSIPDWRE